MPIITGDIKAEIEAIHTSILNEWNATDSKKRAFKKNGDFVYRGFENDDDYQSDGSIDNLLEQDEDDDDEESAALGSSSVQAGKSLADNEEQVVNDRSSRSAARCATGANGATGKATLSKSSKATNATKKPASASALPCAVITILNYIIILANQIMIKQ